MNQHLNHKIEATDTSINKLLKEQKFYIDYFQREYRWKDKHIITLVEDITSTFLAAYTDGDSRASVQAYQNYYIGPVVFSKNPADGKKSIIDGQQRITSITLILIYLNHLQKNQDVKVSIGDLIYSEKYGEKSFNMTDKDRHECLDSLFQNGSYNLSDNDNETVINITKRYNDIEQVFPEEITTKCLAHFIDWFIENVIIVEITAYSDDNAYTIFETMNDRGLSLTSTEMLKGYVLSRIRDREKRNEINDLWKNQIKKLNDFEKNLDQSFFLAWFRAKYAESIRPGKAGSENQDFENIGSRFHNWFKESHKDLFNLNSSESFYEFFKNEFPSYVKWYLKIWDARKNYISNLSHVHYIDTWGIADSLQDPLLLSSINLSDDEYTTEKKIDLVAKYIEIFTVRRGVNYRKFGQASIKYTMFNLIKKIRNNSIEELTNNLSEETHNINESWDKLSDFRLHGQNRKFIKHLLSRITSYVDLLLEKDTTYVSYHHPNGKQFQIEHIWGDRFEQHNDEFDQKDDFKRSRNSIGALILIPQGTNQSYSDKSYDIKLEHYIKENSYAQTLHQKYYEMNPNFLNNSKIKKIAFKPHLEFKKKDINDRVEVVKNLCQLIWKIDL